MDTELTRSDDRRSFLRKAAIGAGAAGAVWVAPTVLSSPAGAQAGTCVGNTPFLVTNPYDPGSSTIPVDTFDQSFPVCLPLGSETITLAGDAAGTAQICGDDGFILDVTRPDTTVASASYSFYTNDACMPAGNVRLTASGCAPAQDITSLFGGQQGTHSLRFRIRNCSGPGAITQAVWIV